MTARRLRLAATLASDANADALRGLARALLPLIREELAAERDRDAWVDVVEYSKTPRRSTMAACRRGELAGAVKRGRVWVAPKDVVDAWLRLGGPRIEKSDDDDELEDLRARVARGAR